MAGLFEANNTGIDKCQSPTCCFSVAAVHVNVAPSCKVAGNTCNIISCQFDMCCLLTSHDFVVQDVHAPGSCYMVYHLSLERPCPIKFAPHRTTCQAWSCGHIRQGGGFFTSSLATIAMPPQLPQCTAIDEEIEISVSAGAAAVR